MKEDDAKMIVGWGGKNGKKGARIHKRAVMIAVSLISTPKGGGEEKPLMGIAKLQSQ